MSQPLAPEIREWIEIVCDENGDDLLRYLQRRVNHPQDAADLLGHVFVRLWENGGRIPTSDIEARMWWFGIARNVLREQYRHAAKNLAIANDLREHLLHAAHPANAADTAAEAQIRASAVRAAVVALDERSRELILLVHWDGFSLA